MRTVIVGMGALGLLYAKQIADSLGQEAVAFAMDEDRLEKYRGTVFEINGEKRSFSMESCKTAAPADLVILAVKYGGMAAAIDELRGYVGKDTAILSVMNGITSEKELAARYGWSHVVDTVAQGMDAVKFGNTLQYTKQGELCIGAEREEQKAALERADAFLTAAGIPHRVEEDILHRIWGKLMLNVGVNQACMACETNYGGAVEPGSEANRLMLAAMGEVMELAGAEGVPLTEADRSFYVNLIGTLSPEGMPSMRQDAISRRPSEVEMFAGTVLRLAEKHRISVPANRYLYQRIRQMEAEYGDNS